MQSDHYKKTIKNAVIEIANSMTRIAGERDQIKGILDHVKDETEVSGKVIRRLAGIYYKQNLQEIVGETEEIRDLYESVMQKPTSTSYNS